MLRLAHLSDLHFFSPSYDIGQLFSKRWLGNLNFLLSRKKDFITDSLPSLASALQQLNITHVVITGDLTTTSYKKEFAKAAAFVKLLESKGMHVFLIPGNHDQYTKAAYQQQLFYSFFKTSYTDTFPYNLKDHGVTAVPLGHHWHLVLLDTALATHLLSSKGLFSETIEQNLRKALSCIPQEENILLANHFPFFQNENPRKILQRGEALKNLLLTFPRVRLYLHGHTHRHCLADLRASHLPIVLDSGSYTHKHRGTFHAIALQDKKCIIDVFEWHDKKPHLILERSFDV